MKKVFNFCFVIIIVSIIIAPLMMSFLNGYDILSTTMYMLLATTLIFVFIKFKFKFSNIYVLMIFGVLNIIYMLFLMKNYHYSAADSQIVFDIASGFGINKFNDMKYLFDSPNNIFITFYEVVLFLFLPKSMITLKVLSVISLYFSFYMSYLIAKKYYNTAVAFRTLILLFILSPLLIITMYPYSDVFAMPYFMIAVYFLGDVDNSYKKLSIGIIAMCFSILLKSSPIILFIALILTMFLFYDRNKFKKILFILFLTVIILFGLKTTSANILGVTKENSPCENGNIGIPATGFMKYSFNYLSKGVRNEEDVLTNYDDICSDEKVTIKEDLILIGNRIADRSLTQKLDLTYSKIARIWYGYESIGYSYLNEVLYKKITIGLWDPNLTPKITEQYEKQLKNEETVFYSLHQILINSTIYFMFISILLGTLIKIKLQRMGNIDYLLMLIIMGYFAFYLMWEIDGRYITVIVPIIAIFASSSFCELFEYIKKNRGI